MRTTTIASILGILACLGLVTACGGGSASGDGGTPIGIEAISPTSGGNGGGTELTITGFGLANAGVGANEVLIAGTPALEVIVVSDTEITCKTPAFTPPPKAGEVHLGVSVDVQVIKEHGTATLESGFTYFPPPTIASVMPDQGTRFGGQPITILGTGFMDNNPGDNDVRIGNKPVVSVTIVDDTTITGLTPSSWLEQPEEVTVTNDNGTAILPNGYLYTGPPPMISTVTPSSGPQSGMTPVTITGSEFNMAAGSHDVFFGGTAALNVVVVNPTTITCLTPPAGSPGVVDVAVQNSNGITVSPGAFEYLGPPIAGGITPGQGPLTGGTMVTITGSNFASLPVTVRFGPNFATSVMVVDDNTLTCVTPQGPFGFVDVIVTNVVGMSTITDGFEYTFDCSWDPTFGTDLNMNDDSSTQISLTNFTFPFFGTNYTSVWVNSNGNITFGTGDPFTFFPGDSDLTNGTPRVSGFFTDLQPNAGGSVHAKELSDRLVVTFNQTVYWGTSLANTFQMVLHESGVVCVLFNSLQEDGSMQNAYTGTSPPGTPALSVVDLSTSPTGGLSSDSTIERWTAGNPLDLDPGTLLMVPNAAGGFDMFFTPGTP